MKKYLTKYEIVDKATPEEVIDQFKAKLKHKLKEDNFKGLLMFIEASDEDHDVFTVGDIDLESLLMLLDGLLQNEDDGEILFEPEEDEEDPTIH